MVSSSGTAKIGPWGNQLHKIPSGLDVQILVAIKKVVFHYLVVVSLTKNSTTFYLEEEMKAQN